MFIREHIKNNQDDFTPILLGLRYGNVPSMNSILSVYNFIDRPMMVISSFFKDKDIDKDLFALFPFYIYVSNFLF